MMRGLALLAAVLPTIAFAGGEEHYQYMPTIKDVYMDCKSAVEKADAGDLTAFYASRCGSSTMAIMTTAFLAAYATPSISTNATAQQKHDSDIEVKTIRAFQHRFCGLVDPSDRATPPELQIAKRYVAAIDAKREELHGKNTYEAEQFDKTLHSRTPYAMGIVFQYQCQPDKKQ